MIMSQLVLHFIMVITMLMSCCGRHTSDKSNLNSICKMSNKKYRLCGDDLTDCLIKYCDGKLAEPKKDEDFDITRKGIVDECCNSFCDPEILDSYCLEPRLQTTMRPPSKRTNEIRRQQWDVEAISKRDDQTVTSRFKHRTNGTHTNKVRSNGKRRKSVGKKRRRKKKSRKRKGKIKRKCIFESFGRLLLRMDDEGVHIKIKVNDTVMSSLQVGTIAPDRYGGSPVVVVSKEKSLGRRHNYT